MAGAILLSKCSRILNIPASPNCVLFYLMCEKGDSALFSTLCLLLTQGTEKNKLCNLS